MQMKRDWKETDPSTHYYYDETGRVLSKVYEKDQLWVTVGADLYGKLTCEKDAFVNLEFAKRNIESSFENYEKRYEQALDIHDRTMYDAKTREWERQQVEIMNAKLANTKKTWWERLFER